MLILKGRFSMYSNARGQDRNFEVFIYSFCSHYFGSYHETHSLPMSPNIILRAAKDEDIRMNSVSGA